MVRNGKRPKGEPHYQRLEGEWAGGRFRRAMPQGGRQQDRFTVRLEKRAQKKKVFESESGKEGNKPAWAIEIEGGRATRALPEIIVTT